MVPLVFVAAMIRLVRPVDDWDIWWHLAVGRWIAEHGTVPFTDPFSAYGQGKPWLAYSWLFEVLVYFLYQTFGLYGIVIYRAVLSVAILLSIDRWLARWRMPDLLAAGLAALILGTLLLLLNERPWLFTVLFTTWTLHAIFDLRRDGATWRVWLLVPMFALWANLHIQFVYGLGVLVLACVAPAVDRGCRLGPGTGFADTFGTSAWRRLVALTAACLLATLANPYHFRLYGVMTEYARHDAVFRLVAELTAPTFRDLPSWTALALGMGAAFMLGRRARLSSFDLLLLAGATFSAMRVRRDLWLLAMVSLMLICESGGWATRKVPWRRTALLTCSCFLALGLIVLIRGLPPEEIDRAVADKLPANAVRMVEERGYQGPLFNNFNWGGYLIWRLPRLLVAMDGRTNLHGDERILRSIRTWDGYPDWDQNPELAAANLVIAPVDVPLVSLLRRDHRYRIVHEDKVAIVFVKSAGAQRFDRAP
jgi:hypothetical protein